MLRDNGPDFGLCDTYDWNARKHVALAWRELIRRARIPFIGRRTKANRATRLVHMVVAVQRNIYAGEADPVLIQRLEAELTASNDGEVRELFAKYLSEP